MCHLLLGASRRLTIWAALVSQHQLLFPPADDNNNNSSIDHYNNNLLAVICGHQGRHYSNKYVLGRGYAPTCLKLVNPVNLVKLVSKVKMVKLVTIVNQVKFWCNWKISAFNDSKCQKTLER